MNQFWAPVEKGKNKVDLKEKWVKLKEDWNISIWLLVLYIL